MDTTVHRFPSSFLPEEIARDYRVVRLLGKGGMGEVYLAKQLRVGGRLVALKIINRSISQDLDIIKRFENEAAIAGQLNHDNIVKIYDCRVASSGEILVAMEYVEGKSLRAMIDEQGPLSVKMTVEIAKQICSGLGAIHRLGIIHRDIKADNIIIAQKDDQLIAKILDFGIARLATNETSLTSSGVVLGSAAYIAPEQAEGLTGDGLDARADIYSLGMVVYKMLTGRVAFGGGSWTNIIYKQVHERPESLRSLRPDIPESVDRVVLKALEKDRSRRQQSAQEFSDDLDAACRGVNATDSRIDRNRIIQIGVPMVKPQSNIPNAPTAAKRRGIARKTLHKILVSVIAAVIGYYIIECLKTGCWKAGPPVTTLVEYRVRPEKPTADFDTLPPGNRVRSGQYMCFQVKLTHPGSVYLLQESSDGSLKWMNAIANNQAQIGREEEWLRVPDQQYDWIEVQKDKGPEKFILLYVPMGVNWSLVQAVFPQSLAVKNGFPTIPPDAASRIRKYIKSDGIEMASSTSQVERVVSNELLAAYTGNQIAFREIKLEYEP